MTIYLVLSMLNINGYFNGTVSYAANENIEKSPKNIFHSPQVEDVSKILIFLTVFVWSGQNFDM